MLPNLKDNDPIFAACERGELDYVESRLKTGTSVYSNSEYNQPLMNYAIHQKNPALARLLLVYGLKPDEDRSKFGDTYLMTALAAKPPAYNIADILLDAGANINATDKYGTSIFYGAAASAYPDKLRYVIAKGGDFQIKTHTGQTPMWAVAQYGQFHNLPILLEVGACDHSPDNEGSSPLARAVRRGFPEVAKWLLEHGADPNVRDWKRKGPLEYAIEKKRPDMVALLEAHGAKPSPDLRR